MDSALNEAAAHAKLGVVAEICCGCGESFELSKESISRGVGVDISLSMVHSAITREYGQHIFLYRVT